MDAIKNARARAAREQAVEAAPAGDALQAQERSANDAQRQLPATLGEKPCPQRPALQARPLLSDNQAAELELLFRLLGNTTRLKILHCLVREGELPVGELCEQIGLNTQAVSNQLRNLAGNGIVMARRCGTNIHYRVVDDCVLELLERGLCQRECVHERGAEGCGSEGCCNG
ncbi:helix-turn-helix transcriptional regulator [bacterium]|nr:helix-turn-helix transcriptional regulator [bacterium]